VLQLRRAVLPLRDIIMDILRSHPGLIDADTRVYLRDVYDHIVQILETVEHDRDMLAGLMDLALARENRRMSEVMKVLTMIATVFIPLTFIAGVYGMNFAHMPELHWPWAYPAVLGLMLLLALGMLVYFRKKDWL
jgi:magnesium transporter